VAEQLVIPREELSSVSKYKCNGVINITDNNNDNA
jgi:hypothetical protein